MGYLDIQERHLLRDLVLPGVEDDVQVTTSGDWPSLAGRQNLHAAHRRRAVTTSGELVHQPDYGAGLLLFLEDLGSLTTRTQMTVDVRQNALRDDRLEEITVVAFLGTASDPDRVEAVTIELDLRPRGEEESDVVTVVVE